MFQRTLRRSFIFIALVIVFAISAHAQSVVSIRRPVANSSWQSAQWASSSTTRVDVVTAAEPQRRHGCRIKSFTADKLVCSRAFGGSRIYLPQQVLAIILPGDRMLKFKAMFGLNAALGAAIWGTVVLAATCPPCAAATSFVALLIMGAAGAVLVVGDDQPDRLLYLAPGQQLTGKLRSIHP